MDFKYKTTFGSILRCLIDEQKDQFLAKASLDELKKIIPNEVIGSGKQDLLPIASNLALIACKNANDDAMTAETAISIYQSLVNKYINIEHSRKHICGHIVSAGFSKFSSNYLMGVGSEILDIEEVKKTKEPFNLCYAGVIYKLISPSLADELAESNDPASEKYLSISSSWEVGFQTYDIAVGKTVYLKDAEIIADTDERFKKYDKILKANGGKGKDGDNFVYRVCKDGVVFLGAGLTYNPASQVKGAVTTEAEEDIDVEEDENASQDGLLAVVDKIEVENKAIAIEAAMSQITHSDILVDLEHKQNISQSNNSTVIGDSNTNLIQFMDKITDISQLTDENLKIIKASTVIDFIKDKIKEGDEQWTKKVTEKETLAQQSAEKLETLNKDHETLKKSLQTIEAELNTLRADAEKREKQEEFNARMAAFDEKYDLSADDRKVIAAQIGDLDEKGFETYEQSMATLLKEKLKTKTAVASVEVKSEPAVVDAAIDNAAKPAAGLPNTSNAADTSTMKERFAKAFKLGESVKVTAARR